MWSALANFVLRFRLTLLVLIGLGGVAMGWIGFTRIEMAQQFLNVVPPSDPDYQQYQDFRKTFGLDGRGIVVGLEAQQPEQLFRPALLNDLHRLSDSLGQAPGIEQVVNLTTLHKLGVDRAARRFVSRPIWPGELTSDTAARAFRQQVLEMPFYLPLVLDSSQRITLCAIRLEEELMADTRKHVLTRAVKQAFEQLAARHGLQAHPAGLQVIRTFIFTHLPRELLLFMLAALSLTALSLLVFYRSLYAVVFPLILLGLSTVYTFGIIGLLGYKVSILTALLPPIIVILGIPPSIYMISDYHQEYKDTRDKLLAIKLMVKKLGLVTLMINANTAFGFLTLILTNVTLLVEFGWIAFLSTMAAYGLTIVIIPGVFSLLPPPSEQNLKHLKAPRVTRVVRLFDSLVFSKRSWIYTGSFALLVVSAVGITQIEAVTYLADDLPQSGEVVTSLEVMEETLGGTLPFEIVVDTRRKNGLRRMEHLQQVHRIQEKLKEYPKLSPTMSIANVLMWSRQALFGGRPSAYAFPAKYELPGLLRYARGSQGESQQVLRTLVDSNYQKARITGYVQDIGSRRMPQLLDSLNRDIQQILEETSAGRKPPGYYLTGTTRIFLKANAYLIENLWYSLLAAFLLIGLQMYLLFGSFRIMWISMLPNLLPLFATAGLMGYVGIPLKPATALIYELAFGIAIDNSIHYLAMYRHHRRAGLAIPNAVSLSTRQTGKSILYTSVVLFAGFVIFIPSLFDSTHLLGLLTAITLFIAFFSNLLLMPALLINFDRDSSKHRSAMIDNA